MLSLMLSVVVVSAPPPKPGAYAGRITLWLGDKYEHFKPDGGDVVAIPVPAQLPYGMRVTPDRKAYVTIDRTAVNRAALPAGGQPFGKLVVTPLAGNGPAVPVEGYVANYLTGTIHGTRVYFTGGKGNDVTEVHVKAPTAFVLDLETKKVTPIPLPEKHTLYTAAPDGKAFFTTRIDTDNNTYSRRTFYVPAEGKPVEVLKENVFPTMLTFSPDSTKVLALTTEYTNVQPNANGGAQLGGAKPREFRVLHPATNTFTPLRYTHAEENYLSGWDWSPDGTQIALLTYDQTTGIAENVPLPGGGIRQQIQYVYKVSVADADGGNAKEVYRTKGPSVKTFMWK